MKHSERLEYFDAIIARTEARIEELYNKVGMALTPYRREFTNMTLQTNVDMLEGLRKLRGKLLWRK